MPPEANTAGLDEAGRGALAGPVVAAAVCLHPQRPIAGLADSKTLTAARREQLAGDIVAGAADWALGRASAAEVDALNVLRASLLAMRRAFARLRQMPELAVVDGNQDPHLPCASQLLVGGDRLHAAVSAASILAKVERDRLMRGQDLIWPGYGFARHKGYGTRAHLDSLTRLGTTSQHRLSFAPVRRLANQP